MENYLPWLVSRKRLLFAIFIDALLNILIYTKGYFYNFNSYPNSIVTIGICAFWIISSYILGRYMLSKKINFLEIFKAFFKTLCIFLSCNIVYFTINLSNKFLILFFQKINSTIDLQKSQNIFFIKITLFISIISFLVQYLASLVTNKIYDKKGIWYFLGSEKAQIELEKEIIFQEKFYKFERIDSEFKFKNINNTKFIEGVIIDNEESIKTENSEHIFMFKSMGINVVNILKWCETELHRIPPYLFNNKYQIIEKFNLQNQSYILRIKRIGDFFVGIFLLIITLPISFLIIILIYLEDKGPILYSQVRTGFGGEKFNVYKFRSMIKNAEEFGPQWSQNEDQRITKVGRIIRALRLDEIPQLLSVLNGRMSLIGPRPERPEIEEKFFKEIPYYKYRYILKPGISGWAQVNYPYGANKQDTVNKLSYDIYYINHISFLLDLLILFKTIKTVLNAKGYKPKVFKNKRFENL